MLRRAPQCSPFQDPSSDTMQGMVLQIISPGGIYYCHTAVGSGKRRQRGLVLSQVRLIYFSPLPAWQECTRYNTAEGLFLLQNTFMHVESMAQWLQFKDQITHAGLLLKTC